MGRGIRAARGVRAGLGPASIQPVAIRGGSEGGRASSLRSHESRKREMLNTVSGVSAVNGSSVYLWMLWYE